MKLAGITARQLGCSYTTTPSLFVSSQHLGLSQACICARPCVPAKAGGATALPRHAEQPHTRGRDSASAVSRSGLPSVQAAHAAGKFKAHRAQASRLQEWQSRRPQSPDPAAQGLQQQQSPGWGPAAGPPMQRAAAEGLRQTMGGCRARLPQPAAVGSLVQGCGKGSRLDAGSVQLAIQHTQHGHWVATVSWVRGPGCDLLCLLWQARQDGACGPVAGVRNSMPMHAYMAGSPISMHAVGSRGGDDVSMRASVPWGPSGSA